MDRGERVARAYIAAVLLGQAVVAAMSGGTSGVGATIVQVLAAGAVLLPLTATRPGALLRGLSVLPAVLVSVYWAAQASPLGTVAWSGWAALTVWLCIPAGRGDAATLAERFHGGPPTTGAHR